MQGLIPGNQKLINTSSEYGFESDLELNFRFKNDNQNINKAKFTLTLTNRSRKNINISKSLALISVVRAELRDEYGRLLDIWDGPIAQWPIPLDHVMRLAPMASISEEHEWPRFYYGIAKMNGPMQCRFIYNTGLLSRYKSNNKIDRANIFSNPIALKCENNELNSLGNWHEFSNVVKSDVVKKDIKLIKIKKNEMNISEESSIDLYSIKNNVKKIILNVNDVDNLVELKNADDALSYVRLFTGIDTHYLFRGINALEVSKTSAAYTAGWGVFLSNDWSDPYEIENPMVKKIENGYIIERCLVSYPDLKTKKSKLYRSREIVSMTGKYHHEILKILQEKKMVNGINMSLPYY